MPRRVLAFFVLALLALPLAGCFVLDEIDKGNKFLDDHSPPKDKDAKQAKGGKGDADTAPVGKKGAIDAYFREEEAEGTTKTFAPGQVSAGIVGCKLAGKTQFMTRESCAARGGREH